MIGLFLGSTDFPKKILNKIKKRKKKYFIIDLTRNNIFKKDKNSYFISIGKFGQILKLINKKKCNKVLFAGKIDKPKISNLKLDIKGIYYLPRIIKSSKLGDAAILKELIKILGENKIKVIKSNFFNPELTLQKGNFSKIKPNKNESISIKKGIKSLNNLNSHDHIQGLIIRNNKVIKKENSRGTKKMLQSIDRTKKPEGILIKFPKRNQDLRADLPTIGLKTIMQCKAKGLKGIVLKKEQNVCLDKIKLIKGIMYLTYNKYKLLIIIFFGTEVSKITSEPFDLRTLLISFSPFSIFSKFLIPNEITETFL